MQNVIKSIKEKKGTLLDVRSTILKDNFLRLRYFTTNHDNFEINKLRKKKINKILDK